MPYPFSEIEPKWQNIWAEQNAFVATLDQTRPKYYVLDMFPYPSSSGLHVGHAEGYTASDIVSRYKRMRGFNVLHPMGWDAFGLPAEQYAIKTGIHPEVVTRDSIVNFKRQLKALGFSYDWSREISTCDPSYYKWTQWIFKKLFEAGLAYQKEVPVNWCPELKTVLANEEVVNGKSERGGHPVEKRLMKQWMLKITAYAEELLQGLESLDWLERTKDGQRHWIGKSEGLTAFFPILPSPLEGEGGRRPGEGDALEIKNSPLSPASRTLPREGGGEELGSPLQIEIFTTRPDTIWGVTFMVLAPEHPLVATLTTPEQREAVLSYQKQTAAKLDLERQSTTQKTGVFTGAFAINPVNGEKIPIWISDYVLMDYGTGAIMAVPGHDERDYEFAKTFDLPVKRVIDGGDLPFAGEGAAVNSGFIDGLGKTEAIAKVISFFEDKKIGKRQVLYKLRDWNFSRQRFWGEPFPIVHTAQGPQAVADADLPVLLPSVENFEPSANGEPPLSKADAAWLQAEGGVRETQTMPGSAGSSWYFLRYADPLNPMAPISKEAESYFLPVDLYIGGAEHTVGHLLYARFWQRFLFKQGLVSHPEPFQKLIHQGMILGPDGEKMSKSRGNVVSLEEIVKDYGADSLRVYEMFMGPLDRDKPWNTNGLVGVYKFLNKVWRLFHKADEATLALDDSAPSDDLLRLTHQTLKKVTDDIEAFSFNTAVSQLMIFVNEFGKSEARPKRLLKIFVQMLSPFAPHLAEELWQKLGESALVSLSTWPEYDPALAQADTVTLAVQILGKTRGTLEVSRDADQATVEKLARAQPFLQKQIAESGEPVKVIFVKNRILNLVFKSKG